MKASQAIEWLRVVAERFGPDLREEVVFLGGATVALLTTDPAAPTPRPTKDVDVIVEVGSRAQYAALQSKLRQLRFREDTEEGAPLCRWVIDGIRVDVMPTGEDVLGFSNRWYVPAMKSAARHILTSDLTIRLVTAPYFVATKLEAFTSRGDSDYQLSHDIEDIVAVVDGRVELAREIVETDAEARGFLQKRIGALLQTDAFVDALPGHLPGDTASQGRLAELIRRFEQISASEK